MSPTRLIPTLWANGWHRKAAEPITEPAAICFLVHVITAFTMLIDVQTLDFDMLLNAQSPK